MHEHIIPEEEKRENPLPPCIFDFGSMSLKMVFIQII